MVLEKMPKLNVTDINLSYRNPFQVFQGNTWFLVGLVVFDLLCFAFGGFCNAAMIGYEKFTGDPQKRSLTNQLLPQIILIAYPSYVVFASLITYVLIAGSIGSELVIWITYLSQFFRFFSLTLCTLEGLVARYISNVVLQSVLPILDDFFALFLLLLNIVLGSLLAIVFSFSSYTHQYFNQLRGLAWFITWTPPVADG